MKSDYTVKSNNPKNECKQKLDTTALFLTTALTTEPKVIEKRNFCNLMLMLTPFILHSFVVCLTDAPLFFNNFLT